jgi:hypothetical protein
MQRPDAPQRLLLLGHGHQLSVGVVREAERRLPPEILAAGLLCPLGGTDALADPVTLKFSALTMVRNSRAMPLPLTSSAVAAYNRSHKPLPHSTVRLLGVSISAVVMLRPRAAASPANTREDPMTVTEIIDRAVKQATRDGTTKLDDVVKAAEPMLREDEAAMREVLRAGIKALARDRLTPGRRG